MTQRKFSFGIAMIPVYVYIGCIIFSTIFSTSREHSLHGIQHHFESTFVLLTYCVLVLYAAYFIDNEKTLKWFINGFLIGVACLSVFGLLQFSSGLVESLYTNGTLSKDSGFYDFMNKLLGCIDKDGSLTMPWYEKLEPFKTDWMANYVYMPASDTGKLTLNFPLGQVYMSLYNPNYIAFFTTLTAPFFATLAFFQKKIWRKIVFALVALASITCLIGSRSVAGFLSLFVSLVILLVAFRKKLWEHRIPCICTLFVLIIGVVGFDFASNHSILNQFTYVKRKLQVGSVDGYGNENTYHFTNLKSTAKGIEIEHKGTTITFSMDYDIQTGMSCTFKDKDGQDLETKITTDSKGVPSVTITEEGYNENEIVAAWNTNSYIPSCTLNIDGTSWTITNQIPTICYAYDAQETTNTPFSIIQKANDEILGDYYYFDLLPKTKVTEFFQSFITDLDSLKTCLREISSLNSYFSKVESSIFNSDNPTQSAATFFNQMYNNPADLNLFFYYITASSDVDANYYYYNQYGKWTQIGSKPRTALFENHPNMASGRGFIWARTIPIMFESFRNFFIGTGPDTFVYHYPHYDYVDLLRGGYKGQIVTKPHSLFLQVGTQTGVPSVLAILALYILYLIATVRLYWKSDFTTLTSKVSVAILASISGYMVSAITNDSTVTYSYVFWGLLGVGIAANRMEKRHRLEEQAAKEREEHLEQKRREREERKKKKKEEQTAKV